MTFKDFFGIVLATSGFAVGTMGYRLLGLAWYWSASVLTLAGLLLIWSAQRDRAIQNALSDGPGDWGDRHYLGGGHATDSADLGDD